MTGTRRPLEIAPSELAAFEDYRDNIFPEVFKDVGLALTRERQRAFLEGGSYVVDAISPATEAQAHLVLAKQKPVTTHPLGRGKQSQLPVTLNDQPVTKKLSALFGLFANKKADKRPGQAAENTQHNTPKKP